MIVNQTIFIWYAALEIVIFSFIIRFHFTDWTYLCIYISIHMSLILWRKDSKCNIQWNFPERKVSVSCCHLEQDTGNRWSCDYSPHRERKCSNSYVYCYRCVIATIQYCNPEIRDTHVHMHNVHTNIFT